MSVTHMYQAFATIEEARAFGKGVLLTPKSRGRNRDEYKFLTSCYVDGSKYPYIRVWNEVSKD